MLWTAMSVHNSNKGFAILPLNIGSRPSLVLFHALDVENFASRVEGTRSVRLITYHHILLTCGHFLCRKIQNWAKFVSLRRFLYNTQ
jgi:hypothetical protein